MLGGLLQLRGLTSGTRELTQKSHKVFGTYNTTDSMQGQPNWWFDQKLMFYTILQAHLLFPCVFAIYFSYFGFYLLYPI